MKESSATVLPLVSINASPETLAKYQHRESILAGQSAHLYFVIEGDDIWAGTAAIRSEIQPHKATTERGKGNPTAKWTPGISSLSP